MNMDKAPREGGKKKENSLTCPPNFLRVEEMLVSKVFSREITTLISADRFSEIKRLGKKNFDKLCLSQ